MGQEYFKRGVIAGAGDRQRGVDQLSSGNTVGPNGVYALATTSTGAPVLLTVATPSKGGGDILDIGVSAVASSSDAPFHLNTPSTDTTFDGTNDMLALSSAGSGVSLRSLSTSQWLVVGLSGSTHTGAAFSTST